MNIPARLTVRAIEAKAGESAEIPLRADLAENLRAWLDDRLRTVQSVAEACDEPVPDRLPMDARVFRVPAGLVRILDRDLAVAGIPKRDDRGRVMDVHAQRHTFGTHLSRAGVPARATQAAMRHSTLDLTMQLYTDPRLLDIAGAIDALPALPDQLAVRPDCLGHHGDAAAAAARTLGPKLVPTRGRKRPESSYHVNGGGNTPAAERVVSDEEDVSCQEMATTVAKRAKGLEPSTFSLEGCESTAQTPRDQGGRDDDSKAWAGSCTDNCRDATSPVTTASLLRLLNFIERLPLDDSEKCTVIRRLGLTKQDASGDEHAEVGQREIDDKS